MGKRFGKAISLRLLTLFGFYVILSGFNLLFMTQAYGLWPVSWGWIAAGPLMHVLLFHGLHNLMVRTDDRLQQHESIKAGDVVVHKHGLLGLVEVVKVKCQADDHRKYSWPVQDVRRARL